MDVWLMFTAGIAIGGILALALLNILTATKNRLIQFLILLLLPLLVSSIIIVILLHPGTSQPPDDIKKATFNKLDAIRASKRYKLLAYLNALYTRVQDVPDDTRLQEYFTHIMVKHKEIDNDLSLTIDTYLAEKYLPFYDVMFVDASGQIGFSIRHEKDFHKNLFTDPELAATLLSKRLRENPDCQFVDFHNYTPSDRPAAFFPVKIERSSQSAGWIIMHLSIHTLNSIMTDRHNLGHTGEVFLVNSADRMLSDSRFSEKSTILSKHIPTDHYRQALNTDTFNLLHKDYRNEEVFSSFETVDFLNRSWLLITEIDEDEILTDLFADYSAYFSSKVLAYYQDHKPRYHPPPEIDRNTCTLVHMNEVFETSDDHCLYSAGISTCTGLILRFPGRFAYMAHIPPTDAIYFPNAATAPSDTSDQAGGLLRKVMRYRLYPYELDHLECIIIAPHNHSIAGCVTRLIEAGVELENIRFALNPGASCANTHINGIKDYKVDIEWLTPEGRFWQDADTIPTLETVIKELIEY